MKLKKLLSFAAATVVAASVVATSASADWAAPANPVGGLNVGTGNWLLPVFCNVETDDIPMTDYNIDLAKLGGVSFTFKIQEEDQEFFNGMFGGGVGVSIHCKNIEKPKEVKPEDKTKKKPDGSKTTPWGYYNWDNAKGFWGVIDMNANNPDAYDIDGEYIEGMPAHINVLDPGQATFLETVDAYTYRVKCDIVNPVVEGDATVEDITDIRVFIQSWNSATFKADVTRCVLFDTDGKAMMAFDASGNKVDTTADDEKDTVMPEPPEEGTDVPDGWGDDTSAASSEAASEPTSAATSTEASSAPAASTPASSAASATSTASDSSGAPVGLIVGIIAGVVVVIVVVVVVVKKKKG